MKCVVIEWGLLLIYSNDIVEGLAYINAPYNFNDICFIFPLTVGQVLVLERQYDMALQLLTIDRSFIIQKTRNVHGDDFDISQVPTPFEYLMVSCGLNKEVEEQVEKAFATFIREEVTILPSVRQIIVGSPLDKRILNEKNFDDFQNILRLQNKMPFIEPIPEDETPRAKKFREKRELRDAIKRKQQSANASTFLELMSAMCAYGVGITPLNIKELSLFSLYHQLGVNGSKERYETEMNFLYGGADPKKLKPKYWITNNNQ